MGMPVVRAPTIKLHRLPPLSSLSMSILVVRQDHLGERPPLSSSSMSILVVRQDHLGERPETSSK